jgi:hypothetical protein
MAVSTELVFDQPKQLAVLAIPALIRTFISANNAGVYMLLRHGFPFYVGRSDSCTQRRVTGHPLLAFATHVAWQPCHDALHAFRLESAWFHNLGTSGELINKIHPARPAGQITDCPFCSTGDCLALEQVLRPNKSN